MFALQSGLSTQSLEIRRSKLSSRQSKSVTSKKRRCSLVRCVQLALDRDAEDDVRRSTRKTRQGVMRPRPRRSSRRISKRLYVACNPAGDRAASGVRKCRATSTTVDYNRRTVVERSLSISRSYDWECTTPIDSVWRRAAETCAPAATRHSYDISTSSFPSVIVSENPDSHRRHRGCGVRSRWSSRRFGRKSAPPHLTFLGASSRQWLSSRAQNQQLDDVWRRGRTSSQRAIVFKSRSWLSTLLAVASAHCFGDWKSIRTPASASAPPLRLGRAPLGPSGQCVRPSRLRRSRVYHNACLICSVLFFSPSSIRGLATPWTYFLHLSLSSVILTDSFTGSTVHVLMWSIQAVHAWSSSPACTPGIVPCIISFSRQLPCFVMAWPCASFLAPLLWQCLAVPCTSALLRTHSFVFSAVHETSRIFLSPFISKASRRFFILSECPAFTAVRCYRLH